MADKHYPPAPANGSSAQIHNGPQALREALHKTGVICDEIATLASAVDRFAVMLVEMSDDDEGPDATALRCGVMALANQIGLLGDMGAKLCGHTTQLRGANPAEWLLSPVYHRQLPTDGGQQ